jgi:hypothetical protein
MKSPNDYVVGYAKPPKATQFRKGVSGNPSGRPKGAKSLSTIFAKHSTRKIKISSNGREQMVSVIEAMIMRTLKRALDGDFKAIQQSFEMYQLWAETQQVQTNSTDLHEADQQVLKNIMKRVKQFETENDGAMESESQ